MISASVAVDAEENTLRRVGPISRTAAVEAARLAAQPTVAAPPAFARTRRAIAKGAVIGFGVGALLGSTVGQEACLHSPRWHCAVAAGTAFGVIGAAVAWWRN